MSMEGLSFNNFERVFKEILDGSNETPFKNSLERKELEDVVRHVINTNQYIVPNATLFPDLPPCKISPVTFSNMSGVNAKIGSFLNAPSFNQPGRVNFLAEITVRIAQDKPILFLNFDSIEVIVLGDTVVLIEKEELAHDDLKKRVAELKNKSNITPEIKALLEKGKYCSMTEKEYSEIANLAAMIASVFLMAIADMMKKDESKSEEVSKSSSSQKSVATPSPVDASKCLYAVTVAAFIGSIFKSFHKDKKILAKSIEEEREEAKRNAEESYELAEKNYMLIMKDVVDKLLKASFVKKEDLKKEVE